MKQTFIGLLIGAVIGAGAMWAFGSRGSENSMSRTLYAADSTRGSGTGGGPRLLLAYDSTLGSGTGSGPRFSTGTALPSGSTLVITCVDKDCGGTSGGGAGTGASLANSNVLLELPMTNGLPANTEMMISYRLASK